MPVAQRQPSTPCRQGKRRYTFLEKDTVQSSVGPRDALHRSLISFHDVWFAKTPQPHSQAVAVFPLTVLKLFAVGALLKSGGYRSPANHFSRAKEGNIKLGFHWSDALQLAVRNATTSITRGIGPAQQSAPLDLAMVWRAEYPWEIVACGLPLGGKLLVCGSFCCTREIEISVALGKHVFVASQLESPVFKNRPQGVGQAARVGVRLRHAGEAMRLSRAQRSAAHRCGMISLFSQRRWVTRRSWRR